MYVSGIGVIAIEHVYCDQQAAVAEKQAATEVAEDAEKAKEAVKVEPEAPHRPPQTAAEIMAAAAKTAEERTVPLCSSRMLLARSLVDRQEKLYDRLSDIRRQFGEIDAEVIALRNARYAHYAHYEERHRQQQAHIARSRLITGKWTTTTCHVEHWLTRALVYDWRRFIEVILPRRIQRVIISAK